jgi:hypothetical protein
MHDRLFARGIPAVINWPLFFLESFKKKSHETTAIRLCGRHYIAGVRLRFLFRLVFSR